MKPERRVMSRREFLIAAGCGCAATLLVGSGCSRSGATTAAATVCPYGYRFDPWPGQCYRYSDSNGSGYCDFSEPLLTTTTQTDAAATTTTAGAAAGQAATVVAPAATATPAASATTATASGSAGTTAAATATPAAAAATPAATATTIAVQLVQLCDRGCHTPGSCGRFTDLNGSGICDLYEGVPADQVAAYGGVRSRRGG